MRVVVAGASGFIGRAVCGCLSERYEVVAVSRCAEKARRVLAEPVRIVEWSGQWEREIDGAFGVINLAGENVGSGRWSKDKKVRILSSRLDTANVLVDAVGRAEVRPEVFIHGSAIGYFGPRGDEGLDESSPAGTGFLAEVCVQAERAARKVEQAGVRYAAIRTGMVLGLGGGALRKMMLPFKSFFGGHPGSGNQWYSWISIEDEIRAIVYLLEDESLSGVFNLTAPNPVTARQFAKTLGRAMKRPAFLPAPGFVLKIMLGEMAEALLLTGQRVLPGRLLEAGFEFRHKDLQEALKAVLGGK